MSGTLFIITAPSGAGKTTLVRALCNSLPNLKVSVSCTTRKPRPGENDGVDYQFIDVDTYNAMIEQQHFLEYKTVFGNHYGTPRQWVEEQLQNGIDIILEIDWQGAREVRSRLPDKSVGIFILPPSIETLEQRLRGRDQDDEETIERRMHDALGELSHFDEFDYLVINDDMERALAELRRIVQDQRQGKRPELPERRDFARKLIAAGGK